MFESFAPLAGPGIDTIYGAGVESGNDGVMFSALAQHEI